MSRKHLGVAAVAAVSVLAPAATAVAVTAPTPGTLVSYSGGKTNGTAKVKIHHKTVKLVVDKNTICGYQRGESGGPLSSCAALKHYKHHTVNVNYTKQGKHEVATLISVPLTGSQKAY